MPPEFYPQNVMPGTRTVIVIGLPVSLPILETTPSVLYHDLYKTVNSLLDQYAYRMALFLEREDYSAVGMTRDGYASLDVLRIGRSRPSPTATLHTSPDWARSALTTRC